MTAMGDGGSETSMAGRRPHVHVLSLGGTIAMTGDTARGVTPQLTADALVDAVPAVRQVADVTTEQFRQVPGASVATADIQDAVRRIAKLVANGCDGVVVTQGTDTIEETAFLLDLLVGGDAPVVVTGAMRNPTLPGADGPANLLGAIRTAVEPTARGMGTLVVLNDEIHAARFVAKRHTSNPGAFASPLTGPVGWVAEDRARLVATVPAAPRMDGVVEAPVPPVALLSLALDDDARIATTLAELGYRGTVVQGLGGGHAPARAVDALASLTEAMPVVLASRTGAGPVLHRTYGFAGSEQELLDRGLVHGGYLDGPKARILMGLGLASGADRDRLAALFAAFGGLGEPPEAHNPTAQP